MATLISRSIPQHWWGALDRHAPASTAKKHTTFKNIGLWGKIWTVLEHIDRKRAFNKHALNKNVKALVRQYKTHTCTLYMYMKRRIRLQISTWRYTRDHCTNAQTNRSYNSCTVHCNATCMHVWLGVDVITWKAWQWPICWPWSMTTDGKKWYWMSGQSMPGALRMKAPTSRWVVAAAPTDNIEELLAQI